MNLGIFNRVNHKEGEGGGMFSEWASLSSVVRNESGEKESVLAKFPPETGKDVALSVVKQLSSNISPTQTSFPSQLQSDKDVLWSMEVICYGLSLPLTENDAIRDCVNIYCDWLTVLHPVANLSVPRPIMDDPNLYARKIIAHLHNLFIPRKGEGADKIKHQALLCHRVLRTLQKVAQCSTIMSYETWEALLIFLLAINETLLAAPTIKDDVGDQLCERVLSVLFEVWLVACWRCFPAPPLWKTLREMATSWRHRLALIHQWNRVNLALTHRVIAFMYGPQFPRHPYYETEQSVPDELSDESTAQAWFRFIHCLGSPVDLTRPQVISQTPKFLQYAMVSDTDPSSHPCLSSLPANFLRAIKGISTLVDAFLGIVSEPLVLTEEEVKKEAPTPPPQRRPAKSFSVTSSTQKGASKAIQIGLTGRAMSTSSTSSTSSTLTCISGSWDTIYAQTLASARPKCNSLLHLFGEWLFEAAQVGTGLYSSPSLSREDPARRSGSLTSGGSDWAEEHINKYQAGRAMSLSVLCKIFCAKKTGEQILTVYYARFYLVLLQGLKLNEKRELDEPLVSILLNCSDLLRLDLDGVQILIPSILDALERVLPDSDLVVKSSSISMTDLRKASINLLLSILVLPLHFPNMVIRELLPSMCHDKSPITFGQIRSRVMSLLISALKIETDPHNTHMLLGGLLVLVQEVAAVESLQSEVMLSHTFPYPIPPSDSANSLFVRATCLVCHRLISSWKGDLSISLAALELLCGLAYTGIKDIEKVEWERGMKWVCDYIVQQCWRPPQLHSKDLHSSIVAAFTAVSTWLLAQPSLLKNKHCLHNVLEVVELGISGSKSVGKRRGEPMKMKDEKDLKPVSMRVRDAAEALLTVVLEHAGYFPSPCGAESVSSLIDEATLLKYSNIHSITSFKYFITHNNIILGFLEDPLGNHQEPQPVVNIILRGGFGRQSWSFQLRQLPRHRSTTRGRCQSGPGRPVYTNPGPTPTHPHHTFFPETISRIPQCTADRSIPELDGEDYEMTRLLKQQAETEASLMHSKETSIECVPPGLCGEFQTARLFLSHFGFLNKLDSGKPSILALDSKKDGFFKELEILDRMEPRSSDTCHVFYVRAGQSDYQRILANVESINTTSYHFVQVLSSLGWPISVPQPQEYLGTSEGPTGGGEFSGHKKALYWADAISQVTFLVPTPQPLVKVRNSKREGGHEDKGKRQQTTYPVFVVWLESLEDHLQFPLEDMIAHTNVGQEGWNSQNCTVIFLHALQSGLIRVKFQPSVIKPSVAIPLVDGIVVSKSRVGCLVRQSVLNICRRKRLDNESYQQPHTRRRLKIQEIAIKYEQTAQKADLLTDLFM